jgi:hypothetical protein
MPLTKIDPFDGIIGLPPKSYVSDTMIRNSMPVLEILPGKPNFARGLALFSVEEDTETYDRILARTGFSISHPIKLAFIADNFPTDTFTNDYGETFLQKSTDVVAENLGQIMQITGQQNAIQGAKSLLNLLGQGGEAVGGTVGQMMQSIAEQGEKGATALTQMMNRAAAQGGGAGMLGMGAQTINKLLANHRIDFPQIWRNSGYTPQYSITIRLYNPNPGSLESTERFVLGPLAAILCLGLPRTTDGRTYNWPFFHRINCRGLWHLDPGVITNINVIKGGDQQQIAYNHRLAMVDVRIDFISLFNSMIAEESTTNVTGRPTLKRYIDQMRDKGTSFARNSMIQQSALDAGVYTSRTSSNTFIDQTEFTNDNAAVRQPQTATDEPVGPRVSSATSNKSGQLSAGNSTIGVA